MRTTSSGKQFRSNTNLEMGLGVTMAGLYLLTGYFLRLHALILYKPSMALCISTLLTGQLILQANNKDLEAIAGNLNRISKVTGGVFLTLPIFLALTVEK